MNDIETIQGNIQKIVFQTATGWAVLRVRTAKGTPQSMTGEFGPEMVVGTIASFHGRHTVHPKYGPSFKVTSYSITHDAEEMLSIKLFLDTIAPNIGPERAENICAHFGKQLIEVLNNSPERLVEVEGVGKVSADSLKEAWDQNKSKWNDLRHEFTLRAFLNALGIKERRVKKIIGHFGGGILAEQTIRSNPYVLADVEGFGFSTADYVARQLGTPEESEQRIEAFVFYALETLCPGSGHLYLTVPELIAVTNAYASQNNTKFLGKTTLSTGDLDDAIEALLSTNKAVIDGDSLYARRVYGYEADSAQLLKTMMKTESDLVLHSTEMVDKHIGEFEFNSKMILSEEQRLALHYFVEKKVFVITGSPGTGKTTVLKAVVDLVLKTKLSLICMTPTGISAKRMAITTGFEAATIHRKLGYRGNEWTYGEDNKLEADVVIVDESSMVDQEVFYRLLAALRTRTHLILVGDDNQLPSVGAGNVLRELVNCGGVPVVKLTQIFRQDEASDIIKVAHRIKDGNTDLSLFKEDPTADVFFLRDTNIARIEDFIVRLATRFKAERRQFQILTPRNDGPLSVLVLNKVLQASLNPPQPGVLSEMTCRDYTLRVGDRIRVKKNDYENAIYNGDVGKVIEIRGGFVTIEIASGAAPKAEEDETEYDFLSETKDTLRVRLPLDEVDAKIKLAYAISVHGCVPKGSLITSSKGLVPIETLSEGDFVLTHKNLMRRLSWVGSVGIKNGFRLITKTGFSFVVADSHPLLVSVDNLPPTFIEAKRLKKDDFICRSIQKTDGVEIPIVFRDSQGRGPKRTQFNPPAALDKDLAWLIGALIGNGCYTDKKDGIVELSCPETTELLSEFNRIVSKYGLNSRKHDKKGKINSYYVCSKSFREFLFQLGLDYVRAVSKSVPICMYCASQNVRASFLAGLFDTDGSVDQRGIIRYITVSEKLALGIHEMLMSMGMVSFLSQQKLPSGYSWCLSLSGLDFLKFKNGITLKCIKKLKRLDLGASSEKTNHYEIPYGSEFPNLFNDAFKKNEGRSRGIKGKGFCSKYRKVFNRSRAVAQKKNSMRYPLLWDLSQIAVQEGFDLPQEMQNCRNDEYYFDQIEAIEPVERVQMYDMEVEKDHSYISSSCYSHNSQGSEYQYVILPFVNQFGKMLLQRNLLYTALTRAKLKVILVGHESAVERAISNASVHKRNTRLGERLCRNLQLLKSDFIPPLPQEQQDSQTAPSGAGQLLSMEEALLLAEQAG